MYKQNVCVNNLGHEGSAPILPQMTRDLRVQLECSDELLVDDAREWFGEDVSEVFFR